MPANRRDVMFAFAATAALGGCATPAGQPAADWQQFNAADVRNAIFPLHRIPERHAVLPKLAGRWCYG